MYDRIQDNQITATYPANVQSVYLPELDEHIQKADFETVGIYNRTRQDVVLAEDEFISGYDLQVIEGRPVDVPVIATKGAASLKTERLAAIAAKRFAIETGGTVVSGIPVKTDRESQALVTGAALAATLDPAYVCRWKSDAGFIQLKADQILGFATAIRVYVQSCFDREAELVAAVGDDTYNPDMLTQGWP